MARADWLRLTAEETLEPGLPIIDTHHHFWDHGAGDRYLLDELLADVNTGHNVVATVFVEASAMYRKDGPVEMKPVGETEFVNGIAAMSASGQYGPCRVAAGIVGHADLRLGAGAAKVLEAQVAASSRFRGIRYWTTWDEHPKEVQMRHVAPRGLMADRIFREGFACLERLKLSYDAWMLFHQLPDCADLARAFPGVTIVVEHFGGNVGIGPYAGRRDEVFGLWKRNMVDLSKCPNVFVKLGGMGVPRNGFGWESQPKPPGSAEIARAVEPFFMHCIEQFGPQRCMFESNHPVDGQSASFHVIWNAFKRFSKGFSAGERAALFHDTAARAYRIGS
jgi:L-fuconolactonase